MTVTLSERPADVLDGELAELQSAVDAALGGRCKVEILGGVVVVSPQPRNLHMLIVTEMRRMLDDGCDRRTYTVTERAEFFVDEYNSPHPDLAVLTRESVERDLDATKSPVADALFVVEVTSPSNADDDRKWGPKYKAYAKGQVPIYLLVDPHQAEGPSFTLFTEPNGLRYLGEQTFAFGRSIKLPEPFETVVIDSAEFPVPRKTEN